MKKTNQKLLSTLLVLITLFSVFAGTAFNALAADEAVCEINGVKYATLEDALATIPNFDTKATIKFLADVTYLDHRIAGRQITFNLNGYDFIINDQATFYDSIITINGNLTINENLFIDGCEFTVNGNIIAPTSLDTYSWTAISDAALLVSQSIAKINGNITACFAVAANNEATVLVNGDINATMAGVSSGMESTVTVKGNVNVSSGMFGVLANLQGYVIVKGNINVTGPTAEEKEEFFPEWLVNALGVGVVAYPLGEATVEGTITADIYITLDYVIFDMFFGRIICTIDDKAETSRKVNYNEYSTYADDPDMGMTVWVRIPGTKDDSDAKVSFFQKICNFFKMIFDFFKNLFTTT